MEARDIQLKLHAGCRLRLIFPTGEGEGGCWIAEAARATLCQLVVLDGQDFRLIGDSAVRANTAYDNECWEGPGEDCRTFEIEVGRIFDDEYVAEHLYGGLEKVEELQPVSEPSTQ